MRRDKAREIIVHSLSALKEELRDWVDLEGHRYPVDYALWHRSKVVSRDDARIAFETTRDIDDCLEAVYGDLSEALGGVGLATPDTISEWIRLLNWLSEIERMLISFSEDIYVIDHQGALAALEPARRWYAGVAGLFSSRYRIALESVRAASATGEAISPLDAIALLERADAHVRE